MNKQSMGRRHVAFLAAMFMLLVVHAEAGGTAAAVQGIVRDSQGVAQMGALVQVLAANSAMARTAYTDLHGRYLIANLNPGRYELRATATLFVPAVKADLQLRTGARTVVNLTLATLFETATWLPNERRRADAPADDWKWTLRSPVNRPILRILGEDDKDQPATRGDEGSYGSITKSRTTLTGGSGFGESGGLAILSVDREAHNGPGLLLETAFGSDNGSAYLNEVSAGYQRDTGSGKVRTIVQYRNAPELGSSGVQMLSIRTARQVILADVLQLELGGEICAVHDGGYAVASRPFLRATSRPINGWTVRYRMATSRDVQAYADVLPSQDLPYALIDDGRLTLDQGRHQELAVMHAAGRGSVQVAVYRDAISRIGIAGIGQAGTVTGMRNALVDRSNGGFRMLATGFTSNGARLKIDAPLAPGLTGTLEYATGDALSKANPRTPDSLNHGVNSLRAHQSQSASASASGHLGMTKVRATYRWQPGRTLTAVNPYGNLADRAYLGVSLRQPLRFNDLLPPGLEATVDVTNLLAQGYQPFVSEDGETLFFAQTPRAMQAGLAFSF